MRVKWNRHLDLGVRQRTSESESPEPTNLDHIEDNVSVSSNNLCRKKEEAQQDSSGFLNIFRTKKVNCDDLSQCSVSSTNSGHLVRRASLPTRLKRKIRSNDCSGPNSCQPPGTISAHDDASNATSIDPSLMKQRTRDVAQHHSTTNEEIIWRPREGSTINRDCDSGRHSSASFSRDSSWRKTLPVPRSETESGRSVYQVGKNPTLTKSASLSTCQPTDGRQTFSNFSQSIKSLEPAQARSGKVNLFSVAKSFFSGSKFGNKKSNFEGSSKLKRSVSISGGKSGESVPDAGPSGTFTRGRWNSVSGRAQSHGNVQDDKTGRPPVKAASKFSELFSSFRSSLKSLDSRSHREHYFDERDDDWDETRYQNVTENNSVSSLLIYEENLESNVTPRCSLEELNKVVSSCLLLPERSATSPKEPNSHTYDDEHYDNVEILKTPNTQCFNGSMTKCELTTFKCADQLVLPKDFKSLQTKPLCSSQSRVYDVKFNEKQKLYPIDKDPFWNRQPPIPVKKELELVHALDVVQIDGKCNFQKEKIPLCQQVVVSSLLEGKCTQKPDPYSLNVVNPDRLFESRSEIYDNDGSKITCKEAVQQEEPVVKNDANCFNSHEKASFQLNDYDNSSVMGKNFSKFNEDIPECDKENAKCEIMSSVVPDAQTMNGLSLNTSDTYERLHTLKLSAVDPESRDGPVNGISTLDGTIVLAEDRPIFCDSSSVLSNDSHIYNVDKVDSHSFQEKAININEIFVPTNNCLEKNRDPALVERDREHYDAVASLNLPNDEIKTGHSNEAHPDSIKDNIDEDTGKRNKISFQTTAASNDEPCSVIATDEITVAAIESVEKRLTSDLNEKGLGSHDSVSLGRHDEYGKEESYETCGQHSPAFPLVDEIVSNPRGRVRWSDTLQSFTASTEGGSKSTDRSSLSCESQISPASVSLSFEEKSFPEASLTESQINVDSVCETKEVMLSDNITTTKSAIKDISGAIAELQNAISSTFGLGCDFNDDDDRAVEGQAPQNGLPIDRSCNWPNNSFEMSFCDKFEIQLENCESFNDSFHMQENQCQLNSSNNLSDSNCVIKSDFPSPNLLLSKTRDNFSENSVIVMKDTFCVSENFCDTAEDKQENTIDSDVPCVNCICEKEVLIASVNTSLNNDGLPHTNERVVSPILLEAQYVEHTSQNNDKTVTEVNNVDTTLKGNPVLEVNSESVIHLQRSVNAPTDYNAIQSVSRPTESRILVDGDTTESRIFVDCNTTSVSNSAKTIFDTNCTLTDFKLAEAVQHLNVDPLKHFHARFQTNPDLFSETHRLHFIGSLDRIPKLNLIPDDNISSAISNSLCTSNLWKCKSEETLFFPNRGCCTTDKYYGEGKTFCRLRRFKALAKVSTKTTKEDVMISSRRNFNKTIKPLIKAKSAVTPHSRGKKFIPEVPNHHNEVVSRKLNDPIDNGIRPHVVTPTIEMKENNDIENGSIHPSWPNGVDADIKSSDSLKDTKMNLKKKNITNGVGSKLINSMPSKQTSPEAVGQVPRPLRGNTLVLKPIDGRGMTEKTGFTKGHNPRSRSSRIPRKQHESGRPIVPPKPIRPPMWLSKAELTQEIQHLSSLCEARTKELNRLKMQTKHVTRGFDALAIAIQYMADDLHVFDNPSLLSNLKQTQEKVNKEKKDLECYEKKIAALNSMHAKEMNDLLETLTTRHESELQEMLLKHTTEMNFLREQHKNELVSFTEALQASCEEERLQQEKLIVDLRKELKQQREEVEIFHQQELDDLEERYQERQNALKDEIRKMQKQLSEAKQTSCTMEEAIQKDTDSKLHWLSEKKNDLQNEVDSLKAVLEIKNNELHALRKENLEMQKEVEELPLAKERIKMLQARAEDLQALMSEKVQIERQLSTEHKVLMESYEKEAKVNKRLSMENEELQWRLKEVSDQSQSFLSHTTGDIYETNAPDDLHLQEESSILDEELPSPVKCSSPISSSKPMFFTYMNDEELASSSLSPRTHYKQIKPCSSSHRPSSARSIKSTSSPSPRKSKGSADSSPLYGGGTPRKMAKHLNRAAQRSSTKQKLSSSTEMKAQDGNINEHLEINVIGLADSLVSSASSDNSVFEPCLLEEHGEEIRETLKLLQEQNNTEFIYDVSSPSYDSNGKWHIPIEAIKSDGAAMDQNISVESIDPKTFYHVAFPVLRDSEATPEDTDKITQKCSEQENK